MEENQARTTFTTPTVRASPSCHLRRSCKFCANRALKLCSLSTSSMFVLCVCSRNSTAQVRKLNLACPLNSFSVMCDRMCSGLSAGSGSSCDWISGPPPLRAKASTHLLSGLRGHDDVGPLAPALVLGVPPMVFQDRLLSAPRCPCRSCRACTLTTTRILLRCVRPCPRPSFLIFYSMGQPRLIFPALPARPHLPWLRFDSIEDAQEVLSVLTPTVPCVEVSDSHPPSKYIPPRAHVLARVAAIRIFATSGHLWSPSLPHTSSSFHLAWPSPLLPSFSTHGWAFNFPFQTCWCSLGTAFPTPPVEVA